MERAIRTAEQRDEQFCVAFKGSPMKRAKLRGLKRNAAVVLGNVDRISAPCEACLPCPQAPSGQ